MTCRHPAAFQKRNALLIGKKADSQPLFCPTPGKETEDGNENGCAYDRPNNRKSRRTEIDR
jgi:hypothetical protein